MNTKHQIHNLIILDESGSMESIKQPVISGFNEIVQTLKGIETRFPEQEHFISLVSFNGAGIKTHLWTSAVSNLHEIDASRYQPVESTPLLDAMGNSIIKLRNELANTGLHNVLVTIFTDGEENASKEYELRQIRELIEGLKNQNWTFSYIGADHDVDGFAVSISISNVLKYDKTPDSIKQTFMKESSARMKFSKDIQFKNNPDNFYDQSDSNN